MEDTQLASLLSGVEVFLKADEYTLNRDKGKFARVCLNVDVTKPLRGTSIIPTSDTILHLRISYEGHHEIVLYVVARLMPLKLALILPRMCLRLLLKNLGQPPFNRRVCLHLLLVGLEVLLLLRTG